MDARSAPSALAAALQAALALSPTDQAQLCALLQRLTNAPARTHGEPLAVRRTVTQLAMMHPASTGIAVAGLLLGLLGLARALLRGMF